jgi:putative transposase
LLQRDVDVVARLHQARKVDFRKAQRLGRHDGLVTWRPGSDQSQSVSAAEWAQLPTQITVRLLRFRAQVRGFRARRITLVTTLLHSKLYPAQALIRRYARRWRLELCLRDLKTTRGREQLRCQSPAMAQKEVLAYLIAHNLMRWVMAEAAALYEVDLERISFKGPMDAVRQYSAAIAPARNQKLRRLLGEDLLVNLVRDQLPLRPNRYEPRAVNRRPKP